MPETVNCPQLEDFLNSENCQENIGGTSATLYVFNKADLSAALVRTDNVYATPAFKAGKGLYKFDMKSETQQVQGESQGKQKGFNLTYNGTVNAVSKKISKLTRALNNLDLGFIIKDSGSGDSFILYDPDRAVEAQSGGIKADTGAQSSDDRQTTLEFHLNGVLYDTLYVTEPTEGGWDSLLASSEKAAEGGAGA